MVFPPGDLVALKRIQIFDIMDAKQRENCLNETNLLHRLHHPNIVKVISAWVEGEREEREQPVLVTCRLLYTMHHAPCTMHHAP